MNVNPERCLGWIVIVLVLSPFDTHCPKAPCADNAILVDGDDIFLEKHASGSRFAVTMFTRKASRAGGMSMYLH